MDRIRYHIYVSSSLLFVYLTRLHAFRNFPQFRILIGGGDGTFGWVLSVLEEAQDALLFKEPPCALLPLGTGNDLARVLSWGPGYTGEKVLNILRSVEHSNLVHLDRYANLNSYHIFMAYPCAGGRLPFHPNRYLLLQFYERTQTWHTHLGSII